MAIDYFSTDATNGVPDYFIITSFSLIQNAVDEPYGRPDLFKVYHNISKHFVAPFSNHHEPESCSDWIISWNA